MIYVLIGVLAVAILVLLYLAIDGHRRADILFRSISNHGKALAEHGRRIQALEIKLDRLERECDAGHENIMDILQGVSKVFHPKG